jgi:hypothetical protein
MKQKSSTENAAVQQENNETESRPWKVETILVDQAREISRGRIHDMPRWME